MSEHEQLVRLHEFLLRFISFPEKIRIIHVCLVIDKTSVLAAFKSIQVSKKLNYDGYCYLFNFCFELITIWGNLTKDVRIEFQNQGKRKVTEMKEYIVIEDDDDIEINNNNVGINNNVEQNRYNNENVIGINNNNVTEQINNNAEPNMYNNEDVISINNSNLLPIMKTERNNNVISINNNHLLPIMLTHQPYVLNKNMNNIKPQSNMSFVQNGNNNYNNYIGQVYLNNYWNSK